MKKNSASFLFLFMVALAVSSCRKEKVGYSTVPQTVVASEKPVRNEILAAVFTGADQKLPGKLQVFDYSGKLIKEKVVSTACANFQRWDYDNNFRYSYMEHNPNRYLISGIGYMAGDIVILDSNLNEINRLALKPFKGRTQLDQDALDLHEFILLSDNHYISMAYYETKVNNIPASFNPHPDVKVVDCIIQEVKNDQVVFEWHSVDYPEFYSSSLENNDYSSDARVLDYFHMNGVSIDPSDNNFIISVRHTDQVCKINRSTGEVVWRLGGKNSDFPLTEEQKFLRQHHATMTNGGKTLMLFDNGLIGTREYSRVVEFNLDYRTQTVTSYKALHVPKGVFSPYMASVQKTDSTYLIGCGSEPRIIEVNYKTLEVLLDIKLERHSYRAYKY